MTGEMTHLSTRNKCSLFVSANENYAIFHVFIFSLVDKILRAKFDTQSHQLLKTSYVICTSFYFFLWFYF